MHIYAFMSRMRTTIDLPPLLLERTKIFAARRHSTMKDLVIEGLERVLEERAEQASSSALERLRAGYDLGGTPLTREEANAR